MTGENFGHLKVSLREATESKQYNSIKTLMREAQQCMEELGIKYKALNIANTACDWDMDMLCHFRSFCEYFKTNIKLTWACIHKDSYS